MEKNKKDKLVILVGIALILITVITTFSRSPEDSMDKKEKKQENLQYPLMTSGELQQVMQEKKTVNIFDVRSANDFQSEHIADSVNFDNQKEVVSRIKSINYADLVVIVSYKDNDENIAELYNFLSGKGFQNIKVLSGGISNWKQEKLDVVSWGNPESFTDQAKITYVSAEELKSITERNDQLTFIIDVRPSSAFLNGHIARAVNISLLDLEKDKSTIPIQKKIIVYGETAYQGYQAGVKLFDLGIINVRVLEGGFSDWRTKKFPIQF